MAVVAWHNFLESHAPGELLQIDKLVRAYTQAWADVLTPTLRLWCQSEHCNGERFFDNETGASIKADWNYFHLEYCCRHCQSETKTYSLKAIRDRGSVSGQAMKLGEDPPFGPPIPPRLNKFIGTDRELFYKGFRSENMGLGIGAYGYYRRVVENQKGQLIDEIIKVAKQINAPSPMLATLEEAKNNHRFSDSVKTVKDAIPEVLKINGHNPLTLLHTALSKGVHELTEEECLRNAKNVRIVLSELCERMGEALKEQNELNQAVTDLMNPKK